MSRTADEVRPRIAASTEEITAPPAMAAGVPMRSAIIPKWTDRDLVPLTEVDFDVRLNLIPIDQSRHTDRCTGMEYRDA